VPRLFDPFRLRGVTLRNRIGVSPMCQYSSEDGKATDWHLVHLGSRAVGGAGLVMCEATAVEARGRISPEDAGIWCDFHVEPLARITRFLKQHGAVPGMQLAHAGPKASTYAPFRGARSRHVDKEAGGWQPIGPSPVSFRRGDPPPREISVTEIGEIQAAFRAGAGRAAAAGYEWLELHAAHGYLCHAFLSPLSNHREDCYGGRLENRCRFVIETVRAIRGAWPDALPLSVRLSTTDWVEGGWTIEDSIQLAKWLAADGADLVDCSSGHAVAGTAYMKYPGWQVGFSAAIRQAAGIATAAVGMIQTPQQADTIIATGQADLVLLGERMLLDPYWPFHAAQELGELQRLSLPPAYDYVFRP
jgi:2,4-dienoyl-CoA reductase-like NADH-dependent reductase (Old Yellow Enzyme family)